VTNRDYVSHRLHDTPPTTAKSNYRLIMRLRASRRWAVSAPI